LTRELQAAQDQIIDLKDQLQEQSQSGGAAAEEVDDDEEPDESAADVSASSKASKLPKDAKDSKDSKETKDAKQAKTKKVTVGGEQSSSSQPAVSSAERAKFEKKLKDADKKIELYKKQEATLKQDVSLISYVASMIYFIVHDWRSPVLLTTHAGFARSRKVDRSRTRASATHERAQVAAS
jgi:hypothetical protein